MNSSLTPWILGAGLIVIAGLIAFDVIARWRNERRRLRINDASLAEQHRQQTADRGRRELLRSDADRLPGPALAAEALRRIHEADRIATTRPGVAAHLRETAHALSQLAHTAADVAEGDLYQLGQWTEALAAHGTLAEHPVSARTDDDGQTAFAYSPRWWVQVAQLRQAIDENLLEDDFSMGLMGRGVITMSSAFGYAAAPGLSKETVQKFMADYSLAITGQRPTSGYRWHQVLPLADPERARWYTSTDADTDPSEVDSHQRVTDAIVRIAASTGHTTREIAASYRELFGQVEPHKVSDALHELTTAGKVRYEFGRWYWHEVDTLSSRPF